MNSAEAERLRHLAVEYTDVSGCVDEGHRYQFSKPMAEDIIALSNLVDAQERRIGRLTKSVTWLRGALHDDAPNHDGPHESCMVWECQRARAVLEEGLT